MPILLCMEEKIYNAINDPNVTFFIFPTAKLKEFVAIGMHPHVQSMVPWVKAAILENKCLPVSKEDVLALLKGQLRPEQYFLMTTGEVRVAGAVQIIANSAAKKNIQGL